MENNNLNDKPTFAQLYGMPIMLIGFIIAAAGVLVNVTRGASWSLPVAIAGLVIYIVGRVLVATTRRRQK